MKSPYLLAVIATLAELGTSSVAAANPKALPFSYATGTQAEGNLEVEQYVDVIAMRLARELSDGTAESTVVPRYQLQTELEYGLTDRIELGLYFVFRQAASVDTPFLRFAGLKQRVRWRFSSPDWPIQLAAVRGGSPGLQRRAGVRGEADPRVANRTRPRGREPDEIEQEWYFVTDETKYLYNPTIGATYELSPAAQIGAEYWVRGRFDDAGDELSSESSPGGVRHYAGPTAMVQHGEFWLAAGAYVRLGGLGDATAVGDSFGRLWVRMIVGVGL